jgi:hypothetical protein
MMENNRKGQQDRTVPVPNGHGNDQLSTPWQASLTAAAATLRTFAVSSTENDSNTGAIGNGAIGNGGIGGAQHAGHASMASSSEKPERKEREFIFPHSLTPASPAIVPPTSNLDSSAVAGFGLGMQLERQMLRQKRHANRSFSDKSYVRSSSTIRPADSLTGDEHQTAFALAKIKRARTQAKSMSMGSNHVSPHSAGMFPRRVPSSMPSFLPVMSQRPRAVRARDTPTACVPFSLDNEQALVEAEQRMGVLTRIPSDLLLHCLKFLNKCPELLKTAACSRHMNRLCMGNMSGILWRRLDYRFDIGAGAHVTISNSLLDTMIRNTGGTNWRSIVLDEVSFTRNFDASKALLCIARHCTNLVHLQVHIAGSLATIDPYSVAMVLKNSSSTLKGLSLAGVKNGLHKCEFYLPSSLHCLERLTFLRSPDLNDADLSAVLRRATMLQNIYVHPANALTDKAVATMAKSNPRLLSVTVGAQLRTGPSSIRFANRILNGCNNLRQLHLTHCCTDLAAVLALLHACDERMKRQGAPALQDLSLQLLNLTRGVADNTSVDDGIAKGALSCDIPLSIRRLTIKDCSLRDEGLVAIARAAKGVKEFCLSISPKFAGLFPTLSVLSLSAIGSLHNIETLQLDGCIGENNQENGGGPASNQEIQTTPINSTTPAALTGSLTGSTQVEFAHGRMIELGLRAIGIGCTKLQTLHLGGNYWTNAHLDDVAHTFQSLKHLTLSSCSVTEDSLRTLSSASSCCRNLHALIVRNCRTFLNPSQQGSSSAVRSHSVSLGGMEECVSKFSCLNNLLLQECGNVHPNSCLKISEVRCNVIIVHSGNTSSWSLFPAGAYGPAARFVANRKANAHIRLLQGR